MAQLFSNIAKVDHRGSNLVNGREQTPDYKVIEAIFTTTATTATTDVINYVKLPLGSRLFPTKSSIISSAALFATTCTVNVGTETDDDILATAININAAGNVALDLINPYELTVDENVIATITATGAVTAAVTATLLLAVILP